MAAAFFIGFLFYFCDPEEKYANYRMPSIVLLVAAIGISAFYLFFRVNPQLLSIWFTFIYNHISYGQWLLLNDIDSIIDFSIITIHMGACTGTSYKPTQTSSALAQVFKPK